MREQLNADLTLVESISQGSDFIEINGERKHVISYLEDFLFVPQRARSTVKSLSGGERNRLLLARLFTRPANVLVLDEPTNDLDIETLELLETLLQSYAGTLFLVSHDRAFLDNVVTQVIAFEGNSILREYVGGYEEWVQNKHSMEEALLQRVAIPKSSPASHDKKAKSTSTSRIKLSYQEARELAALPEKIDLLEKEQSSITTRLSDSAIYRNSPEHAKALQIRFSAIEQELTKCFARWEELESKQSTA
jgi:ATP-binding cassette subfamily F protein uup